MIRFDNWNIEADGEILARQFDNKTRTLTVAGDLPAGWEWVMLVQVDGAMDILPLQAAEGGLSIVLTAEQLSIAGYYTMQLRGTQGEMVKHTNTVNVYIPASLSGDAQWPAVPSEFTELERRVSESADRAEEAAKRAEEAGGGGGSAAGENGGHYTPSVSQPTADTMQVTFTASKIDMPAVPPVTVTLPAGPAGAKGDKGDPGADGKAGADGKNGESGVYVGSGEMPDNCNVQIDPDGEPLTQAAILSTPVELTEEQKAQARENIGAVSEDELTEAIEEAMGMVDLEDYELLGTSPQYLGNAKNIYDVVVDAQDETEVSFESDTVADLTTAKNIAFSQCEETFSNGVYTLSCTSNTAWYTHKKSFTIDGLIVGERYTLYYDATNLVKSTAVTDGGFAQCIINDLSGNQLGSNFFYTGASVSTMTFTATENSVNIILLPLTSGITPDVGVAIQYRDIWVNRASAPADKTSIYKMNATVFKQTVFKEISGGVTVTTTPSANIYTKILEEEKPSGSLFGKKCVCFGDSITGNYTAPYDYPSIIAEKTGMTVVNGGFGGCRMAQHPSAEYNAFSMYSLANSIASSDWSVQDAAVGSVESMNAVEHLSALKAIDWSTVDIVTILYGTNDFTGGVPIEYDGEPLVTSSYKGALRQSIEAIMTAYPNIRVVLVTPIYRYWSVDGSTVDSDSYALGQENGVKLTDFVDAVVDVADEYKIPVFNLYNTLGINKINRTRFLSDGTHPSSDGIERIGEKIAARLDAEF